RLAELPLGGTAVGTGVNAPPGFAGAVISMLAGQTGLPLVEARNHFEAQGARDAVVETSGQLRTVAVGLFKIANDIRWMGSGPRAGLRELLLPDLQPGSSIMPGKVNPVVCESVRQVCAQVVGNDATIGFAGAAGDFELNVMLPVMGRNLLESVRLLAAACRLLADKCVAGLVANEEVCRAYAEGSPSIVTPLNRHLGYEEAAEVAKHALATGRSIREVVVERGHIEAGRLTEAELDEALARRRRTRPRPTPPPPRAPHPAPPPAPPRGSQFRQNCALRRGRGRSFGETASAVGPGQPRQPRARSAALAWRTSGLRLPRRCWLVACRMIQPAETSSLSRRRSRCNWSAAPCHCPSYSTATR